MDLYTSLRGFLEAELKKLGREINRTALVDLGNELRKKFGSEYIVMQLYKQAVELGCDCVIESIRTVGEVEALKELENFNLWAVDAPPELRYRRIIERNSLTDNKSFEEFLADEARESFSTDKDVQNLSACIAMADHVLVNDFTEKESFYKVVEVVLEGKLSSVEVE